MRKDYDALPLWFTNLRTALLLGLGIICTPHPFELEVDPQGQEAVPNGSDAAPMIDIWWVFDDGGLTISAGYAL